MAYRCTLAQENSDIMDRSNDPSKFIATRYPFYPPYFWQRHKMHYNQHLVESVIYSKSLCNLCEK